MRARTHEPVGNRRRRVRFRSHWSVVALAGEPIGRPNEGGASAKLRPAWLKNCSYFLRRQVEIVAPKVVVALGGDPLFAVRHAFKLPQKDLTTAVADPEGDVLFGNTRLLAVFHCGSWGLKRQPLDLQLKDWARIGKALLGNWQ